MENCKPDALLDIYKVPDSMKDSLRCGTASAGKVNEETY